MRLPRVRIRSLMVLVLIVGCGLGWVMHRARVQREAVAAIRRAGCYAKYDWEWGVNARVRNGKMPPAKWLKDRFDVDLLDYLSPVVMVQVEGPRSNEVLLHLQYLRDVEELYLDDPNVTDAGIEPLDGLGKLRWLNLGNAAVTDAGLAHLKGLPSLQMLNLHSTGCTDAGLSYLKELTTLQILNLRGPKITDAGMVYLNGLTSLEILSITDARITDSGLVSLAGLTKLKELDLRGTQVTDGGIRTFQKMRPDVQVVGPERRVYPPVRSTGTPAK